jgi:GST-like protein
MEVKRQLDVLDRRLAESEYMAGDELHDRRHGDLALVWRLAKGLVYGAGEFLQVQEYKHVSAGPRRSAQRPAVSAGAWSTAWGEPAQPIARTPRRERLRHDGPRTSWRSTTQK